MGQREAGGSMRFGRIVRIFCRLVILSGLGLILHD